MFEYIDIIDERENIVGKTTRQVLYREKYLHKIVHVLATRKDGKIMLQRRSSKVSFLPNYLTTSAGSHVSSGETELQAINRELQEELGISTPVEFIGKTLYQMPNCPEFKKILYVYKTQISDDVNFNKKVVKEVEFYSKDEINKMLESEEKIHDELIFLFKKFFI